MTKREQAEGIVETGGQCPDCECESCVIGYLRCTSDGMALEGAKAWLHDHAESQLQKAQRKLAKWEKRVKELEEKDKKVEYPCVMIADSKHVILATREEHSGHRGIVLNNANMAFELGDSSGWWSTDKKFSGTIRYKNGKPVETVEDE